MNRTELLQKIRTMQFTQIYRKWKNKELRQADAAEVLNMSERMFGTLQGRLPQELREEGIRGMEEANEFLEDKFVEAFNEKFSVEAREEGSAFVPLLGVSLENILCLKNPRVVGNDNCVSYKGMSLQIPPVKDRYHFVRAKVMVHEYPEGNMAIYHGKRRVGVYDRRGVLIRGAKETVRAAALG